MPAAIRRCAPATTPTASCRSTSSPNGSTYSLLEPLETAGLTVVELDELTALPEYRNGGLLVDLGAIRPRAPIDPQRAATRSRRSSSSNGAR